MLSDLNIALFYFFYNFAHQSPLLDNIVIWTAIYLPVTVAAVAALYLLFKRKSIRDFIFVFFTAGLAAIISKFLKVLFHTPRPAYHLSDVQSLFEKTTYAFPSDHATFFMALALAIYFIDRRAGRWFLVFAFAIGIARIMAGVHFPVDIAGGFVLGTAIALLLRKFKV